MASITCTCGYEHIGCCLVVRASRPCEVAAVGALVDKSEGPPWVRLYCAAHWEEAREAAVHFPDLMPVELGPRGP